MRSLSVIALMLVTISASAQAFNCGMIGMIADDYGDLWVARMNYTQDTLHVENALTCETKYIPMKIVDTAERARNTILWLDVKGDFSAAIYRVKVPNKAWDVLQDKRNPTTAYTVVYSPVNKRNFYYYCDCGHVSPPLLSSFNMNLLPWR